VSQPQPMPPRRHRRQRTVWRGWKKGEAVAGIPDPMTRKDLLKISGLMEAQLRHCERLAKIADRGWFQLLIDEQERRKKKVEKAVVRELYRLHRQTSP
jgi:hypothetical protein